MSHFQNKKWSDHGSKAEKWEMGLPSSLRKHIYLKRLLFLEVKGRGGGSKVKKFFFFVLTYIVALSIFFLKWAHFLLNSQRLPRYDATKMAHFHAFSAFCIGKSTIFVSQNNLPFLSSFPVLGLENPFSGYK